MHILERCQHIGKKCQSIAGNGGFADAILAIVLCANGSPAGSTIGMFLLLLPQLIMLPNMFSILYQCVSVCTVPIPRPDHLINARCLTGG